MSARTEDRAPEQTASLPADALRGYLAGVGAGAALLAAALLTFTVLVGMVSFNLWPQATPRAPAAAAELNGSARAADELSSTIVAATMSAVVRPLGGAPPIRNPARRDRPDPAAPAPTPPIAGEDPAAGERGGGATSGGDEPDRVGDVSGGSPRGWVQGSGNGYGRGKSRGSGRNGTSGSRPTPQGSKSGRPDRERRQSSHGLPASGSSPAGAGPGNAGKRGK